jgi:hypothetical protein
VKHLVIRRSAIKMWLVAVLAVPFVLYGADVLLRQRFVGQVLDLIHPDGELPSIETRDLAWAWVFVIVGGGLAIWGLKELILPRKVLEAGERGLSLRIGGPFSQPVLISWSLIRAVRATRASDDGDVFPVVTIDFAPGQVPRGLPAQPWGARWVSKTTLAISAQDWDRSASRSVEEIEAIRPKLLTGRARYRIDPAEEMLYEPFPVPPLEEASTARSVPDAPRGAPPADGGSEEVATPVPADGADTPAPLFDGSSPEPADAQRLDVGAEAASVERNERRLAPVEPPTPPPHVVIPAAQTEPSGDRDAPLRTPVGEEGEAAERAVTGEPARHWRAVGVDESGSSDWVEAEPDLPRSRFTTSHWIILDTPEDAGHGTSS